VTLKLVMSAEAGIETDPQMRLFTLYQSSFR
jgi:hypothetical protein